MSTSEQDVTFFPFDESKLSAEDLAVLRDFEKKDWNAVVPESEVSETSTAELPASEEAFLQEMLLLFIAEAEEDVAEMTATLSVLEQMSQLQGEHFSPLRRAGHKLRGSAGSVSCTKIATIAGYIEDIAEQVTLDHFPTNLGLQALSLAHTALVEMLQKVVTTGQEDEELLRLLVAQLEPLVLSAQQAASPTPPQIGIPIQPKEEAVVASSDDPKPCLRVELSRVEQLVLHAQQLTEQRTVLESSQVQVHQALHELRIARTRLDRLQPMLSSILADPTPDPLLAEHSSPSLIARILADAQARTENGRRGRWRPVEVRTRAHIPGSSALWDEMDIERYSEKDLLIRSLSEAIADLSLATEHVESALAQRDLLLERYTLQTEQIQTGVKQLRLAQLGRLLPGLQQVIQNFVPHLPSLKLESEGESIEVDQTILEALTQPLKDLLRTALSDLREESAPSRVWFRVQQQAGLEVQIEIGFSMPISGGALEGIRIPVEQLHGSVSLARNAAQGVSFHIHVPHTLDSAHCLLVRVGEERILVPTMHIQRIGDRQFDALDSLYDMGTLLGLPAASTENRIQPLLILQPALMPGPVGVAVDEVLDEIKAVIKPLANFLRRPGAHCTALDEQGNLLLMLDLPEIIRHQALRGTEAQKNATTQGTTSHQAQQAKILIADDSVFLRQSLRQMLEHAHYTVFEARDGMLALEQLLEHLPDILLLDIEMPNLSGYDVLRAMQAYPRLAHTRTIMLSSRSSEKHIKQAQDLNAAAYFTKPAERDALLAKIKELLTSDAS